MLRVEKNAAGAADQTKLTVIRGAAPARPPLGDRCCECRGRRVIADPITESIVRCPSCHHTEPPAAIGQPTEQHPVDAIARAA